MLREEKEGVIVGAAMAGLTQASEGFYSASDSSCTDYRYNGGEPGSLRRSAGWFCWRRSLDSPLLAVTAETASACLRGKCQR